MAFRWLDLFNNPHRLATLLLGIAICLSSLHTLPPSSATYFLRAEYTRNSTNAVASTIWFSSLGYCKSQANNDALNHRPSTTQCSNTMFGYHIRDALDLDGMDISLTDEKDNRYEVFTMGFIFTNTMAIILSLVGVAAHQSVLRKPTVVAYTTYMASCVAAMISTFVALFFKLAATPYIMLAYPPAGVTFMAVEGPINVLWVTALIFQILASTVGFYSYIGGQLKCEAYKRGVDEETLRSGVDERQITTSPYSSLEEKCPL
ncbi:hypothetical protein F5Y01DRAFT_310213 [Xylaria sp. FL0043]|nr:hypothetical protein F5Y01DRAFT_310213 [Xylaria sp. FL0043]